MSESAEQSILASSLSLRRETAVAQVLTWIVGAIVVDNQNDLVCP